jgi:hypothetical protein
LIYRKTDVEFRFPQHCRTKTWGTGLEYDRDCRNLTVLDPSCEIEKNVWIDSVYSLDIEVSSTQSANPDWKESFEIWGRTATSGHCSIIFF